MHQSGAGPKVGKRRKSQRFVSRGGDKLEGTLEELSLDVGGMNAADLGANVGGFTDCLLQRGARRVYAVDTAYGVLHWKLRQDERVVVMERTNALHVALPEPVDLVVIDAGWTRLGLILPHAQSLLREGGIALALLKPQYEAEPWERRGGIVLPASTEDVASRVVEGLEAAGLRITDRVPSRVPGAGGNTELFLLVQKP
jgi:23S rRNA (cytidine1920-2'-O)/16S rRNA (cytidine1409-2'-O)-methyltransferase